MHEKSWHQLSREKQDLYLTLLWYDNHSENAIADFLGTTKGCIVRRRQSHLALSTDDRNRTRVKKSVDHERFRDLLELHAMAKQEAQGVDPIAGVATCEWPLSSGSSIHTVELCNAPVVPGSRLCKEHRTLVEKM